jgi:hypothetical protein
MATGKVIDRDLGYKRISRQWKKLSRSAVFVDVGIQGPKASEPKRPKSKLNNVEIATVDEFGSRDGRIPQRSFLRSTFDENQRKYKKLMKRAGERAVLDGVSVKAAFTIPGEAHRTDIIRKIDAGIPPPNAESTLRRKRGGTTPLINFGQLKGSISVAVEVP